MGLVGALLNLDRRLAAVCSQIDLLQPMHLAGGIGGECHQRPILAVGIGQIPNGGGQRGRADAAPSQIGLDTGAVRILAASDDFGDLRGALGVLGSLLGVPLVGCYRPAVGGVITC